MKKTLTIISAILALTSIAWGQHFVPVWTGNGVDHENFYFSKAILNGIDLEAGDEIAIFDSIYCIGTNVLTQPLSSSEHLSVIASRDDEFTTEVDGYTIGNSISYKIWDNSEGMEIDSVVATYISGSNTFVASGTVSAEITGILVFDITTAVNPVGGGSTTGDGTHDYNSTVSLSAIPENGYDFVNWTETNSGDTVSVNSSYSFTVINDSSFTANFVLQSFNIDANANPSAGGLVSGGGPYDYNTTATLTATTNTGYNFTNWTETNSGDTVATSLSFDVVVTNDSSFTANFILQSFNIQTVADPSGGGTVSGSGPYDYNTTATLSATPATGYNFTNWTETNSGDTVTTSQSFDVIVTNDSSFTANFILQSFNIQTDADPTGGGTISGGGPYDYNTTATLTATPETGYVFVNWTETNSGDTVSVISNYSFTVISDSSFTANFALQSFTINTGINPSLSGTVSGGGSYDYNEIATLTANPATGYDFLNWIETSSSEIISINPIINITVTSDSSFTANFVSQSFNVGVTTSPSVGGDVSGGNTYIYNEMATLTATPNTGYNFVNWVEDSSGDTVSVNSSYSFTVVSDSSFTAHFELKSFTIEAIVNPTGGGTISGDGQYNYNQTASLIATNESGFEFVNWTETNTGDTVSINPGFDVLVTSDSSFIANFIRIYNISASANPSDGGTITGTGPYTEGSIVNLSAATNTGYSFVNWTEGGTPVSTNPDYSYTATTDRTLVANFTGNQAITFNQAGWHIMSFFVTPPDPDMAVILAPLVSEGSLDKVQNERGKAFENVAIIGWVNEIGDWAQTEGYKIRVNTNTQLNISGEVIALPSSIPLETGWNIMGFPSTEMQNSQDMVSGLISSGELVKVQDQSGSAIVFLDPNWVYDFANFNPGEGYKINVNTNTSITIDPLSNKSAVVGPDTWIPVHFAPSWTGNGYNHMNIYVLPEDSMEAGDELAAFDGNVCVGIGVVDPAKDYISLVATMDDPMTTKQDGFINDNKIQLRIWNKILNKEYMVEDITFHDPAKNKYMESGTSLIQVNLKSINPDQNWNLGNAYPNPFNDFTTVTYSVAEETNVIIEIYNATGQKIKVLSDEIKTAGDYTINWDRTNQNGKQVASGTYFYRMTANNYSEVKTLIYMNR